MGIAFGLLLGGGGMWVLAQLRAAPSHRFPAQRSPATAAATASASPPSTRIPIATLPDQVRHWDLPFAIITASGEVEVANPAFQALVRTEASARPKVADMLRMQDPDALMRALQSPMPTAILAETKNEDARVIRLHLLPLGGGHLLAHPIDLAAVKELEGQLAQSRKMQAIGQLAGGVAHDFNNLLTAMIGYCDLLLQRHRPGDASFADIMQIKQNGNRAASLVRQLLAFSRQQTLRPKVLDVTDTIAELSHLLRRLIGQMVQLDMGYGRDLPPVKVDEGQLEQVIINLAVNARDAMPQGGKLFIRTRTETVTQSVTMTHDTLPPGEYVVIEVSDTGTGIPPEIMNRIFEPFFTTKPLGSGTGLGLATVYGIVRQTGGYIDVRSRVGGPNSGVNSGVNAGTDFIIYLPKYDGAAPSEERQGGEAERTDAETGGQGTILLVEDEDPVRLFTARALRNKGYKVLEAKSGEVALEMIEQGDEAIDLLITDVMMPNIDGPTLIGLVRKGRPDLPVICVSGHTDEEIRDRLSQVGDVAFLPKPFSLKQLAGRVKDLLGD